jgi:hypothetical protein
LSCSVMYSRARSMPGDPEGRGPILTISRRCWYARVLSKTGADGVCAHRAEGREQRAESSRTTNLEPERGTRNLELGTAVIASPAE